MEFSGGWLSEESTLTNFGRAEIQAQDGAGIHFGMCGESRLF